MAELAKNNRNEFVTPEHLLFSLVRMKEVGQVMRACGGNPLVVADNLLKYINSLDKIPESADFDPELSSQLQEIIINAIEMKRGSSATHITVPHLLKAIIVLPDSDAAFQLNNSINFQIGEFFAEVIANFEKSAVKEEKPDSSLNVNDIEFDDFF